jgi:hypothetical protein
VHDTYVGMASLVERIHRQFLEVIKVELEALRVRDINSVQGLMLFNIGDAEMTVSEVTLRGCYLGSNVSYNLKKMVENCPSSELMGQSGPIKRREALAHRVGD